MKFRFYAFKLAGIMILIFLLQFFFFGFTELFLLNENSWSEPWRFLSSIFLHGDLGHLVYNLFALILFGSILEKVIGGSKFLRVFFITGILANLISVNFYGSSLGASGSIFGVIGALIFLKPMMIIWAFSLPMPLFVAGIIWAAGDFLGAIGFFTGNPIDNTGNLAHLAGMFFGLIFGSLYKKRKGRNH
ncbi:hypothetical protein CXT76_01615 [Candidatus Parvarchaeota archaeon]|jgi:membrane associated rhomboid family serine protease|nr:MAG: hypothetical protein CXT76_01615 [Candidatus Parvarchaeota archaeon]HIG52092.1 rhomboid family intramembrane serine protease [Candidatus Pacearchaeota archaeon]